MSAVADGPRDGGRDEDRARWTRATVERLRLRCARPDCLVCEGTGLASDLVCGCTGTRRASGGWVLGPDGQLREEG